MRHRLKVYCPEDRKSEFVHVFQKSGEELGFSVDLIDHTKFLSSKYSKFVEVYRHFSSNSVGFELACFKRYFVVSENSANSEMFALADSDVLFNIQYKDFPEIYFPDKNQISASVGRSLGSDEFDISPHFSIWNKTLIEAFCDFCIYLYSEQIEFIENEYRKRRLKASRCAISDMTLIRMFVDHYNVSVLNTNRLVGGYVVDHNISMRECENAMFNSRFGFKKLHADQGSLKLTSATTEVVTPVLLHLQGKAKTAARAFYERDILKASSILAAVGMAKLTRSTIEKLTSWAR